MSLFKNLRKKEFFFRFYYFHNYRKFCLPQYFQVESLIFVRKHYIDKILLYFSQYLLYKLALFQHQIKLYRLADRCHHTNSITLISMNRKEESLYLLTLLLKYFCFIFQSKQVENLFTRCRYFYFDPLFLMFIYFHVYIL